MSAFPSDAAQWLCWLARAESALIALPTPDDDYALYELTHHFAARACAVDACYVCLYRPADESLFFVYNFDEECYDEPLTVPLGEGPTSWVVEHRAPFVLDQSNWETHNANINFGDGARISRSALHLPLQVAGAVWGVFSVQSYQPNAYCPATLRALQLWCDRVALHLHCRAREREQRAELESQAAHIQNVEAHAIGMADHFVSLLQPLTRQAQEMAGELLPAKPLSRTQLKARADALCRSCYRLQTEASQLPLATHLRLAPAVLAPQQNPLSALSDSELEVLRLLSTGASNAQVAQNIGRTVDTAKKHCAGIYRKLGARNRTEPRPPRFIVATPRSPKIPERVAEILLTGSRRAQWEPVKLRASAQ